MWIDLFLYLLPRLIGRHRGGVILEKSVNVRLQRPFGQYAAATSFMYVCCAREHPDCVVQENTRFEHTEVYEDLESASSAAFEENELWRSL